MVESNPIVDALDHAGYRLTEPRRAVADLIAEHDGHFTAAELETAARERRLGISRATLFRALELLTELGVVERLDLPTGEHAYVPALGRITTTSSARAAGGRPRSRTAASPRRSPRSPGAAATASTRHRLELFGLCRHCQAKTTADA